MSPYPAQVSREAIVERARALIEGEGLERLTLHRLAAALGVQAPSLYRHVASKQALLQAVNAETARELVDTLLATADPDRQPAERLLVMAQAYREFAHAHPATYSLAFNPTGSKTAPDPQYLERLALLVQAHVADLTGAGDSLAALRGLWALIHGFTVLELAGQFQRGGNLDATYTAAVAAYLRGWNS